MILYSREYCHLCHDMLAALETMRGEHDAGFTLEVVDVDADPVLLSRYDERVPVLVGCGTGRASEPRELCHYFLDAAAVRGYLAEAGFDPIPD
ncbi:MAG: glutaredoxin family protein [Proteobacteria bacterium]|nr:glutaredoxin family protein [Pseudomonadota bacterium]